MDAQAALRRVSLLAGLSEVTLARLAHVALQRAYAAGEMIIFQDEPCQAAYLIARGSVRVFRLSASGREQVLVRLAAGKTFNTVAPFLPQGANHATVQAITETVLYVIMSDDFRRLVSDCSDLAMALLQDFADRLDHLTGLVEDLSLRTVRGRLARFLLDQAVEGEVSRGWTLDEIAAQLGTVRDMVGRTLRAFADADLIRFDRQRITLVNREGLVAETML